MSGISGFHRPAPKNDLASRVRFPQHQAQASLKKTISTVMDDSVERALYDEILGPLVNRGASSYSNHAIITDSTTGGLSPLVQSRPTSASNTANIIPPYNPNHNKISSSSIKENQIDSNDYFSSTLVTRLTTVESENKLLRRQLAEKCKQIDQLETDNAALRILAKSETTSSISRLNSALNKANDDNIKANKKLMEIEKFLLDYGLTWIGEDNLGSNDSDSDISRDFYPSVGCKDSNENNSKEDDNIRKENANNNKVLNVQPITTVDYEIFKKGIDELNRMVCSEEATIQTDYGNNGTTRRARLVQASERLENMSIVFYKNGLMIKRGPFRYCDTKSYHSFVRDIIDGYYPVEYRDDFPDGVIFDLKDKHDEFYIEGESKLNPVNFLAKLPKTIMKNGEIIDIRSDIADRIGMSVNGGSGNSCTTVAETKSTGKNLIIINTPALSIEISDEVIPKALIQLKWIDGTTLQLKMFQSDLVGDVREQIMKHFMQKALLMKDVSKTVTSDELITLPSFELRTAYPSRLLSDSDTLGEAGLIPNGILHARLSK